MGHNANEKTEELVKKKLFWDGPHNCFPQSYCTIMINLSGNNFYSHLTTTQISSMWACGQHWRLVLRLACSSWTKLVKKYVCLHHGCGMWQLMLIAFFPIRLLLIQQIAINFSCHRSALWSAVGPSGGRAILASFSHSYFISLLCLDSSLQHPGGDDFKGKRQKCALAARDGQG